MIEIFYKELRITYQSQVRHQVIIHLDKKKNNKIKINLEMTRIKNKTKAKAETIKIKENNKKIQNIDTNKQIQDKITKIILMMKNIKDILKLDMICKKHYEKNIED